MPADLPGPVELLAEGVADGVFPGASLSVGRVDGPELLVEATAGLTATDPRGAAVRPDTLFDIASLTKLYTSAAALRMVADGRLDLDLPVGDRIGRAHLKDVTPRMLLEHRSGLPAWQRYYDRLQGRAIVEAALSEGLTAPPGARPLYSDIGFLVLMAVLEAASAQPLDRLVHREVLDPLRLDRTGYRAVGAGPEAAARLSATGDVAATEVCPARGLVCGEVHDDNAWALGGIGPHAGLFADAADVLRFARAWFAAADSGYLPSELWRAAWEPATVGTHVLGWDTKSPGASSAGALFSPRSVGHLGFTGTSLWIDPDRRIAAVLLTNRVHPRRDHNAIRAFRPRLHDAVARLADRVQ